MVTDPQSGGEVLEVAAAEGDLNTFLAALEVAGIMDGLHGAVPFTVYNSTDAAFTAYLVGRRTREAHFRPLALVCCVVSATAGCGAPWFLLQPERPAAWQSAETGQTVGGPDVAFDRRRLLITAGAIATLSATQEACGRHTLQGRKPASIAC